MIGAARLADGIAKWQANLPITNDTDDVESFGEVDVFQSLGVSSTAYPKDADGHVRALLVRNVGGRRGVVVGGVDPRNTEFLGKQTPGDTTLHATGPGAVSQCFVKNKRRQAGLATEDESGETMVVLLDGVNKKVQVVANGAVIEIDPDGDIALINATGNGLLIQASGIHYKGPVHFPGIRPGMALQQGPAVGDPSGILPTFAVAGIGG